MKHWGQMLATYVYNYCNICNIPIYFYNIHIQYLQHTSETNETLKTNHCNMRFQKPWQTGGQTEHCTTGSDCTGRGGEGGSGGGHPC
jgi:hypothetical protein